MSHLHSYPSIYALGHRAIGALFTGPVVVQEKVDGSQFSFGINEARELSCRSKGADIILDAPQAMFAQAVATAVALDHLLVPGWTYRGEYLQKPKHNVLAYSRIPAQHIVLFDIDAGGEHYLEPHEVAKEAERLGLEVVPTLYMGTIETPEQVQRLLQAESFLGGVAPEGVVVKNYTQFTPDKKVMLGKYVTEAFKEKHEKDWKASNPTRRDVVATLIGELRTDARWQKGVQHLRDAGTLDGSPKDIGPLIREVVEDVKKEETDYIKDKLFQHFWPEISRAITGGLPQWYKDQLLASAFPVAEAA